MDEAEVTRMKAETEQIRAELAQLREENREMLRTLRHQAAEGNQAAVDILALLSDHGDDEPAP